MRKTTRPGRDAKAPKQGVTMSEEAALFERRDEEMPDARDLRPLTPEERADVAEAVRVMNAGGIIVYPTDTIWGIGMEASDPNSTSPAKWKGKNLLGKALMRVRDALKSK